MTTDVHSVWPRDRSSAGSDDLSPGVITAVADGRYAPYGPLVKSGSLCERSAPRMGAACPSRTGKPSETHTPPAWRNSMPGIDYRQLRERIPMSQVLELLGFQPRRQNREQLRGPCPIHGSSDPRSDIFAVHLGKQAYYCHGCHASGNQLDLWAAVHKLSLHPAAFDLCRAAHIDPPWLPSPNRFPRCKSRPTDSPRNH